VAREVSIRERENSTASVVEERDPWLPSAELRRIVREAPADPDLLDDLAEVRGVEIPSGSPSR
jgi:hypothetical protein